MLAIAVQHHDLPKAYGKCYVLPVFTNKEIFYGFTVYA